MIKFDFQLVTSKERSNYIESEIKKIPNYKFTQKELETIGSYILYGKDEDGTSSVQKKDINIQTKYNSYSKKSSESLEELIETPGFDERNFFQPIRYKQYKAKFIREENEDIPTIKDLWADIDYLDHIIKVTEGKEEDSSIKKLTQSQLYMSKHQLIEMRREQFTLRDIFKPTSCMYNESSHKQSLAELIEPVNWSLYQFYPMGLFINQPLRFILPSKCGDRFHEQYDRPQRIKGENTIDFTNLEHIYQIIENYGSLKIEADNFPDSTAKAILDTLNFYIQYSKLLPSRTRILELKIQKKTNEEIRDSLQKEFGLTHTPNYISTIYKKNVCGEIAEAAELHYQYYLNRDYPENFKKCSQCGATKLKDNREFMRKSKSSDGLSSKCKDCEKENRDKKKLTIE